jgi:HK97 family phage prohead protease
MRTDKLTLGEAVEVYENPSGNGLSFRGYAAVFNVPSEDFGGYRVTLLPGAFDKSLKAKRDIRMFLNHNDNIVLASTRAKTLRLSLDDKGLIADADLPDNEWGRPVGDAVRRGDIHTMSIGFNSTNSDYWSDDNTMLYKKELRLHEVSPITSEAAFPQTTAAMYSLAASMDADRYALEDAIEQLATGQPLSEEQAQLIDRAAAALRPVPDLSPARRNQYELDLRELELKVTTNP